MMASITIYKNLSLPTKKKKKIHWLVLTFYFWAITISDRITNFSLIFFFINKTLLFFFRLTPTIECMSKTLDLKLMPEEINTTFLEESINLLIVWKFLDK